ncbi:MAG: energy transducer TonB [Bacteroidota bacterium]
MDARIRSRSLLITLMVHTVVLLALIFAVMTTPNPPFPDMGGGGGLSFVDIGYVDESVGDLQPATEVTTTEPGGVLENTTEEEEEVATQDAEESPIVKETPKKKTNEKKQKTDVNKEKSDLKIDPPRRPDPNSLFKGNKNKSVSQGTGVSGSGDEGNPQGDPNSKYKGGNGTGGGKGNGSGTGTGDGEGPGMGTGKGGGVSFSLSGRKWNRPPPLPRDNTQETGKVVVDITVDKTGQVVSATPGGRGSTTTSAYLFRLAKEAALKAKFDENPDAADIQRGTITFIFVVQ